MVESSSLGKWTLYVDRQHYLALMFLSPPLCMSNRSTFLCPIFAAACMAVHPVMGILALASIPLSNNHSATCSRSFSAAAINNVHPELDTHSSISFLPALPLSDLDSTTSMHASAHCRSPRLRMGLRALLPLELRAEGSAPRSSKVAKAVWWHSTMEWNRRLYSA